MKTKMIFSALFFLQIFALAQEASHGIVGKNVNAFTKVDAPSIYRDRVALGKTQTTTININWKNTFPDSAQTAIQEAAKIWEWLLNSSIPIKVEAEWKSLDENGVLAQASPTSFKKNFAVGIPSDIQYPIALAEKIAGQNLNGDTADIKIEVNSNASWYYGIDGNPPAEKFDLVSVALHELCHGLGFVASFAYDTTTGNGFYGYKSTEFTGENIYDNFCVKGQPGILLTSFTNGSSSLGSALISDDIFFNGPISSLMNNSQSIKLFDSTKWIPGSNISHLDEKTYPEGSGNSLMSYSIDYAEAIHSPGEIGLAILEDLGWSVNRVITVNYPNNKTVVTKGQPYLIKWNDNQNGYVTIKLFAKDGSGNFTVEMETVANNDLSNKGKDSLLWSVNGSLPDGDYQLKFAYGSNNYSLSNPFKINSTIQVATPIFNYSGGTYALGTVLQVQLSCATDSAQIRYLINPSSNAEPDNTSPLYVGAISVSANTVIKARAFKSGYSPSATVTVVYTFATGIIPAPVVTPVSGEYLSPLRINFLAPSVTAVRYTYTYDGTEPCDPRSSGCDPNYVGLAGNSGSIVRDMPNTRFKIKFVSIRNDSFSTVVYRDYNIVPAVRVYQADSSGKPFGTWSRWETNQWKSYSDTIFVRPTSTTNWVLRADTNYKSGTFQKFNLWTNAEATNYKNHSAIQVKSTTANIIAQFTGANNATVQAQLLEGGSPGGYINFADPWKRDFNESPYGTRNRAESAIFYQVNYATNNVGTNTGTKGVFLNQNPNFIPDLVNYSVSAPATQPISDIASYFLNWSGSNVTFQNSNAQETGVVFTSSGATVTANYKGTHISNTPAAYANSSARKFVRTPDNVLHQVYESMGHCWYEVSWDNGTS